MKIGGIIAEYNPFHKGHAYQISRVRKECDAVVAVMSGSFAQRGTMAVYDKFIRSRAAVLGGADLVIELPCAYTLAPAELFASGAVMLMNECQVINHLYFGCECGDTNSLYRAAEIMMDETPEISQKIKENLKTGMGYKAARLAAYVGTIPTELINQPNNILGIEYIKALILTKSKLKPHAIMRKNTNHNDTLPVQGYASGNAIRTLIASKGDISPYVPANTRYLYSTAVEYDRKILDSLILYMLRVQGMKVFDKVFDAPPEMVSRIFHAVPEATSLEDILDGANTRQYAKARIRRAIMAALLDIDGALVNTAPQYIRVLAFNDMGREVISQIQEKSKLPVIIKTADFKEASPLFEAELRATELSSICRGFRRGLDFTNSPAYVNLELISAKQQEAYEVRQKASKKYSAKNGITKNTANKTDKQKEPQPGKKGNSGADAVQAAEPETQNTQKKITE